MKTFKSIWASDPDQKREEQKELVLNRNKRAVDAAIDNLKDQAIEARAKLNASLEVVADGGVININDMITAQNTLKQCEEIIASLTKFKTEFFSEE